MAALLVLLLVGGCDSDEPAEQDDPHVVRNPGDLEEDPGFVSPPTLGQPIYACSQSVTVQDFIPGAKIEVFIDGAPAPNPSFIGQFPDPGAVHNVGAAFTTGQVVHVTQTFDGTTSAPSQKVTVTSHTEDFPDGLPKPRLFKHPLRQCGHAVLVEDVVPGSSVAIDAENPANGGFDPAVEVGSFEASTEWGHNWTGVNPEFALGARISATAKLCTDNSSRSDYEITEPEPSPVPPGKVEEPVIDGQQIVKVWGETGPGDPPEHGPIITVYDGANNERGKSVIPGGVPHNKGISPAASAGETLSVTQTLCVESSPGPTTTVLPCEDMPGPKIQPPLPGDTEIHVIESQPGAEILVFVGTDEIGHSSGTVIHLSRPLMEGETVKVVQKLGDCEGPWIYQIDVECALGDAPDACSGDWPAFRHNGQRTARQVQSSPLGDPYAVKTLEIKATVDAPDGGAFTASPVVYDGRVYIGTSEGHLYAYDANFADGAAPIAQYPPADEPPLLSQYEHNPSSHGIAASVAIGHSREHGTLVILGAPDQGRPDDPGGTFGAGLGSGRVFALDPANLNLVWKTNQEVAVLNGLTVGSKNELHEQIGYSAPLVLDRRIYVGIANHADNPIQNGKVKAIDIETGNIISGFSFEATSERGGGVWTFVSGGLGGGLTTTTGNTRNGTSSEPSVNHGLSMIRLDPANGNLQGKIQPVPYVLDADPDWAAGAALMAASCGDLSVSTMKDGWTYGAEMGPPLSFRWQYPNTAYPFPPTDPNNHGDIRYHRAGAAWNDTFVSMMGGQDIVAGDTDLSIFQGYQRLHALDVCAGDGNRVRWVAHLGGYTGSIGSTHSWGLGPPTVTDGIVYVGTNSGYLLAIADPSRWPAQAARCTLPGLSGQDCIDAGYDLVPNPTVLRALELGGNFRRTEPALANGTVYAANASGWLFRIAPD